MLAAGHPSGSNPGLMLRTLPPIGLILGLAIVAVLVVLNGYQAVARDLFSLGWGVALLPLAFLPNIVCAALSWRLLFLPGRAPGWATTITARWIATSVNTLLPLAGVSGEVARLRIVTQAGVAGTDAGASVIVDKTIDAVALVLWGLIGISFLIANEADGRLIGVALSVSVVLAAGIAGFVFVQRAGAFGFLARRFFRAGRKRTVAGIVEGATDLDTIINALYAMPARLLLSTLLRLFGRMAASAEIWLAIALMGQSITIWDALMLRSLTAALRGAAFFIPGGWGFQEGGFVLVGGLMGMPADFMLAVSLATRGRELLLSVPGLLAWQHIEGRSLWKRHVAKRRSHSGRLSEQGIPTRDGGESRRPHFIVRTIATDPWSSFLDGLAFLGFFRVNARKLKDRYAFVDGRLQKEFENIRRSFPRAYRASLPNISRPERDRMAGHQGEKPSPTKDEMEDYWIFFHELSECIAKRVPERTSRTYIFSTVYHALVHGMYNAVIHGDPDADIELRSDIGATAVTLEMMNRAGPDNDSPKQYHTRFGIHVGGGGNTGDTLAHLFDHAELLIEEPGEHDAANRVRLVLRHDLKPQSWVINLKRAFLARAIGTRDRRQLYRMSKEYL